MAEANQTKTIGDLLTRDLSRKIEEIIQVDQADVQSVHDEITEYIATDSIREQYHDLLKAVAEAPSDPHESVGAWVSGIFGFIPVLGFQMLLNLATRRILQFRCPDECFSAAHTAHRLKSVPLKGDLDD